jgi:hypothetical protein
MDLLTSVAVASTRRIWDYAAKSNHFWEDSVSGRASSPAGWMKIREILEVTDGDLFSIAEGVASLGAGSI